VAVVTKGTPPPSSARREAADGLPPPSPVDRVLSGGLLVAAIAVGAQTVAHLTNSLVFDYEHWNADATADGNALSWASSVATFTAALGAVLLGLLPMTRAWRLVALGAVFAFFSLDDVIGIHETLAFVHVFGYDPPNLLSRALWPLLYLPLFAFAIMTLWRLSARVQDRIRRTIWLGLGLFVVAFVAEAIATVWWDEGEDSRFLVDDIEVAIEEGSELGAWIVVSTAFAAIVFERLAPYRERMFPRGSFEGI
jgi:hypothetical protein